MRYIMGLDIYEMKPPEMRAYLTNYGWHFSKRMSEWAVSMMTDKTDAPIKPYTREQVESMLKNNGIKYKEQYIYDAVYVANMAKADFYGSSIADEQHLAKYVGDYLNDHDGTPEIPFARFYADTVIKGIPVYWEDML